MTRGRTVFVMTAWMGAMACAVATSKALAQGGEPDAQPREAQPERTDRPDLRARLERRLEDLKRQEEQIGKALDRLRAGASEEEIEREIRAFEAGRGGRWLRSGFRRGEDESDGRSGGPPVTTRDGRRFEDLSAEQVDTIVAWGEASFPEMWRRMNRREIPRTRVAGWFARRYAGYTDATERDEQLGQLTLDEYKGDFKVMHAYGELMRAHLESDTNEPVIEQGFVALLAAIEQQFDARLAVRRHELSLLKKRVESAATEVESQAALRSEIIADEFEKRKADLLRRVERMRERRERGGERPSRKDHDGRDRRPGRGGG